MNRKTLALSLIVLIIAISIVGAIFYWQSFKTVTYKLRRDDISATIFKQDGDKKHSVDTIDKETVRQLQRGKYFIVPNGDIYSPAPIEFEVKDSDITVEIKPDYSSN